MKTEPNESAFARPNGFENDNVTASVGSRGLTKLEYFAALAMQGMVASAKGKGVAEDCELSVRYANQLIYELNKSPG
jgi:hypothetical protein